MSMYSCEMHLPNRTLNPDYAFPNCVGENAIDATIGSENTRASAAFGGNASLPARKVPSQCVQDISRPKNLAGIRSDRPQTGHG